MAKTFDELVAEAMGGRPASAASPSSAASTHAQDDPLGSVLAQPTWFDERWSGRTTEAQRIFFRLVSEATVENAQITAVRQGWDAHPNPSDDGPRQELTNTFVLMGILAKACVNEQREPFFGKVAEDSIRTALTPAGVRRVYQAFELFCRDRDQPVLRASDDELSDIALAFTTGVLETLPESSQRRIRMLAALIRSEL